MRYIVDVVGFKHSLFLFLCAVVIRQRKLESLATNEAAVVGLFMANIDVSRHALVLFLLVRAFCNFKQLSSFCATLSQVPFRAPYLGLDILQNLDSI